MEIKEKNCNNCDWRMDKYCRVQKMDLKDLTYKCACYIRKKLPTDQSKVALEKTQSNCNTINQGGQVNEKN